MHGRRLTPEDVVRLYLLERRKRENPPSIQGIDPDAPRGTAGPSGNWEALLGLMRGVSPMAVAALDLLVLGYVRGGQWEVTAMELDSGRGVLVPSQTAQRLTKRAVATRMGLTIVELDRLTSDAYGTVSLNLATRRVLSNREDQW